jgi:hypothetical protein
MLVVKSEWPWPPDMCVQRVTEDVLFGEQEVKETFNRVKMMFRSTSVLLYRAGEERGPVFPGCGGVLISLIESGRMSLPECPRTCQDLALPLGE